MKMSWFSNLSIENSFSRNLFDRRNTNFECGFIMTDMMTEKIINFPWDHRLCFSTLRKVSGTIFLNIYRLFMYVDYININIHWNFYELVLGSRGWFYNPWLSKFYISKSCVRKTYRLSMWMIILISVCTEKIIDFSKDQDVHFSTEVHIGNVNVNVFTEYQ